tara:strand:+ start:84 stop:620 length:537 start_codon:yes stop_codon:yes gene_type:complete
MIFNNKLDVKLYYENLKKYKNNDDLFYRKKNFLKAVGIKSRNIFVFLQSLSGDNINELDNLQLFKLYLNLIEKDKLKEETNDVLEEMNNYKILGFTHDTANKYVTYLKHVYQYDSTINWVFRIAESHISESNYTEFKSYIEKCKKQNNDDNSYELNSNNKSTMTNHISEIISIDNNII